MSALPLGHLFFLEQHVRRTQRRDEQGSTLIMALVMLTVVGLMVGAALTYAGTSLRSTNHSIRPNRSSLYGADSAMQTAIRFVRDNAEAGQDVGLSCAEQQTTLTYPDPKVGNVPVEICAQGNSFTPIGRPGAVLLALGTTAADGIDLASGGDLYVNGHVYSHAGINVSSGASINVKGFGRVFAHRACSGPIFLAAGYTPRCNLTSALPVGADPDYPAPAAPSSITQPTVPLCVGATTTATLVPGVYTDVAPLNALSACDAVWLQPGYYFFDFKGAGGNTWTIQNKSLRIVAGTLTGPLASITYPGGCDPNGDGAQLVFAGDSRLNLDKGALEVCGRPTGPEDARVSVYGLRTDIAVSGPPVVTTYQPAGTIGTTAGSDASFVPASSILPTDPATYPNDGTPAHANIPKNKNGSAVVTAWTPSMPTGAVATDVKIRVRHQESVAALVPTLKVTNADDASCTLTTTSTPSLVSSLTYADVEVPLNAANCPGWATKMPLTATWTVANPTTNAAGADLDGIEIEATIPVGGTIPKQSTCLRTSGQNCKVIVTGPGADADFRIVGIGYLPDNWVDLQPTNKSGEFVTQAIVVRKMTLHPSSATAGDPLTIGDGSAELTAGDVLLTARIGGSSWIRSHITFPGGRASDPHIDSWVIDR